MASYRYWLFLCVSELVSVSTFSYLILQNKRRDRNQQPLCLRVELEPLAEPLGRASFAPLFPAAFQPAVNVCSKHLVLIFSACPPTSWNTSVLLRACCWQQLSPGAAFPLNAGVSTSNPLFTNRHVWLKDAGWNNRAKFLFRFKGIQQHVIKDILGPIYGMQLAKFDKWLWLYFLLLFVNKKRKIHTKAKYDFPAPGWVNAKQRWMHMFTIFVLP